MEQHDDIGTWLDDLTREAREYAEHTREYYLLIAAERAAAVTAGAVQGVVTVVMLCMVLLLVTIAGALWVGDLLGHRELGFLSMAGLYLFAWIVFRLVWAKSGRERFMVSLVNAIHGRA